MPSILSEHFLEPLLLLVALAAPLAAFVAARLWRRRLAATAAWASRGLWDRLLATYDRRRLDLAVALPAVALLGLAVALARPLLGEGEELVERRGVDLVFVLDSSLSMAARDVRPSRLYVAESLVRRLVEALPGNRVALVQAEGRGEVLTPLTVDGNAVELLLDAVEPGSLEDPGTELAPALDTALELFFEGGQKHRVVVLLTDGEDHGGGVERRLEALAEDGVVIHALGVGTPEGAPVPLPAGRDGRGGDVRRYQGKVVISQLGEPLLEQAARATGGIYLRAESAAVDLSSLLARIREMETTRIEARTVVTGRERFQWPLAVAAAALLLQLAVGPFRGRRRAVRAHPPAAPAAPSRSAANAGIFPRRPGREAA